MARIVRSICKYGSFFCDRPSRSIVTIFALCLLILFEVNIIRKKLVVYGDTHDEWILKNLEIAILDQPGQTAPTFKSSPSASITGSNLTFQLTPMDRVMTLVHVGKAGGLTTRSATSLMCRLSKKQNDNPSKVDECIERYVPPNNRFSRSVHFYFHMYAFEESELERSTSFLVMLRNPVERVISNFRYSHPQNCHDQPHVARPWGCQVLAHLKHPLAAISPDVRLFGRCFPSPAMEDLAQSTMSPWPTDPASFENMTVEMRGNCRWIARQFLQGKFRSEPSPHMGYNYEYYRNWTLLAFPDKEVFGIRTTHEWQDMKALDWAMGGDGFFKREGRKESHGSESYKPSPLTTQAYQKLCCVLEKEIFMYFSFLNRVINLSHEEKLECVEDVRVKCGIQESWQDWRSKCTKHLERDEKELLPLVQPGHEQFFQQATALLPDHVRNKVTSQNFAVANLTKVHEDWKRKQRENETKLVNVHKDGNRKERIARMRQVVDDWKKKNMRVGLVE